VIPPNFSTNSFQKNEYFLNKRCCKKSLYLDFPGWINNSEHPQPFPITAQTKGNHFILQQLKDQYDQIHDDLETFTAFMRVQRAKDKDRSLVQLGGKT